MLLHIPIALLGGGLYMLVELLWRGRTHWTMGVLGGVCFVLIGVLDDEPEPLKEREAFREGEFARRRAISERAVKGRRWRAFSVRGTKGQSRAWKKPPVLRQMAQGAAIVTVLELLSGLVLNVWLGLDVWDYSGMPGNILGQVCPQYTAAWFLLSFVAVKAENWMHKLFKMEKKL